MRKKVIEETVPVSVEVPPLTQTAPEALNQFLIEHHIKLSISVFDQSVPFVGDGFVLTDKPLLKITAEYING